jgi:hypothetical protein
VVTNTAALRAARDAAAFGSRMLSRDDTRQKRTTDMTYQTKNVEQAATCKARTPRPTMSKGAPAVHVPLPLHESRRFINEQLPHLACLHRDAD